MRSTLSQQLQPAVQLKIHFFLTRLRGLHEVTQLSGELVPSAALCLRAPMELGELCLLFHYCQLSIDHLQLSCLISPPLVLIS